MNAPYICSRCKASLRSQTSRSFRGLRRGFVSFADDEPSQPNQQSPQHRTDSRRSQTASTGQKLRYSGKFASDGASSAKDSLSKLFADAAASTHSQARTTRNPPKRVTWDSSDFRTRDGDTATDRPHGLSELLQSAQEIEPEVVQPPKEPLPKNFVKSHLESLDHASPRNAYEILQKLSFEKGRFSAFDWILFRGAKSLNTQLVSMLEARIKEEVDSEVPTLDEIVGIYESLGQMGAKRLHYLLSTSLRSILSHLHGGQNQDHKSTIPDGGTQVLSGAQFKRYEYSARLLEDVIRVWNSTSNKFLATPSKEDGRNYSWRGLVSAEEFQTVLSTARPNFEARFLEILQGPYSKELGYNFASEALLTLYCYRIVKEAGMNLDEAAPEYSFIHLMEHLTSGLRRSKRSAINDVLVERLFGKVLEEEKINIPNLIRDKLLIESSLSTSMRPKVAAMGVVPLEEFDIKSGKLFSDLRKATKEENVQFMNKLWNKRMNASEAKDAKYLSLMYEEFLWSFVQVVQIEMAIEVWTTMKSQGITPTINHWTAMIEACKRYRDVESLHSIWRQLKDSGLSISNNAWSTYISTLIHCRQWQEAIKAVQEMVEGWKKQAIHMEADKQESRPEYGPSIAPINAAISGLHGINMPDVADSVLKYAEENLIKPNIETFNIRLRRAVRKNDNELVQQILAEIQESDCSSDIVTFTTIIDGVFRNRDSGFLAQSTSEQQAIIDQVFRDMEGSGIEATAHTYAVILHSLLQRSSNNIAAARAVLERMYNHGIPVSTHIYSMLVQHYFSANPPDLNAIEVLWRRLERDRTVPDHVFFDRMVEGYAKLGHTTEMMRFLRMMPQRGKLPGWISLTLTLKCLVRHGELADANALVKEVEDHSGIVRMGVRRGWKGETDFKDLVADLRRRGLIEEHISEKTSAS